ncbi:MAG: RhuM [Microgenomates group bacterium GW2011_GWC1_46_16]|uniref:Death-on-curing protein n=2 Tax=Candidatus Collieribacteriota TaxID=1752725 RepID=A0A1F5FZ17_9BACT|nr:MAG: RhuM [Microgenomates group bacterium GW2011_GWF1_46_12]KKU26186.1 MAG: RhuM [Microgenomates group bacterium GW2011_GWC1_46_16]KKU28164.1 MAG: RhuM [Microgenomates group bacterium GW2011_GWF2_46_18]KKU43751.1 MAG: RhuM [Microgenomates group bacterium GW2011_GWA1_46_7]KKU45619.1 MAG: RhuM [Microgenomates group bacterium GW2011_GWB1_46_7]KKU61538.1 MAG: RhuM [Microgenomates group bacterium GW2011_GWE1_47_12]KKU62277.1 MAG: RhuM [Microgenomates group bacterium GW2011_GWD1_47_13]OGD70555.
MNKTGELSQIIVYQAKDGAIELKGDYNHDTVWATQAQIAQIFGVNSQAITKHIANIYDDQELEKVATCSKMEQVQKEGNRQIKRQVYSYNLDLIIAVGYRINSVLGTKFRIWATKTLRSHILTGYTINKKMISRNYDKFLLAVEDVKRLLPTNNSVTGTETLELIKLFASTWFSLDAYDKSTMPKEGATLKEVVLTIEQVKTILKEFRQALITDQIASEFFGIERERGGIASIVGNILQSYGKEDLYPTIEEKAAHLLYFVIKNHPLVDGNKRSGAFIFIWLLRKYNLLDTSKFTATALTTITILIAESNPKDKDRVIGLILLLLQDIY